jgi:hypothetical protein
MSADESGDPIRFKTDLRARIARRLAELHGAADTTREPLYTDDADAAIAEVAAWLRSDEAEAIRADALDRDVPPEDALAHALEGQHG